MSIAIGEELPNEPNRTISISDPILVRDLAVALELKWHVVIKELMDSDVFVTKDTEIDFTTAAALCSRHGVLARKVA